MAHLATINPDRSPQVAVTWIRLEGVQLRLLFRDGTAGDAGFSAQRWTSVLAPLNALAYFAEVTVDPEAGTLVWPGGIDLAPGVYDRITWNFLRYLAGYRTQMAPHARQLIACHAAHAQLVVLRIAVPPAASSPTWPHRRPLLPAWPPPLRSAADFLAGHQAGEDQGRGPANWDRVQADTRGRPGTRGDGCLGGRVGAHRGNRPVRSDRGGHVDDHTSGSGTRWSALIGAKEHALPDPHHERLATGRAGRRSWGQSLRMPARYEASDLFELPEAAQCSEYGGPAASVAHELAGDVQGSRVVAAHCHRERILALIRSCPLFGGKQVEGLDDVRARGQGSDSLRGRPAGSGAEHADAVFDVVGRVDEQGPAKRRRLRLR